VRIARPDTSLASSAHGVAQELDHLHVLAEGVAHRLLARRIAHVLLIEQGVVFEILAHRAVGDLGGDVVVLAGGLGLGERFGADLVERGLGHVALAVIKAIRRGIEQELSGRKTARAAFSPAGGRGEREYDREELLEMMEAEMLEAAEKLEFEKAAALRDRIAEIKAMPSYGAEKKITLKEAAAPVEKPGMARSTAGRSGPKKRLRG